MEWLPDGRTAVVVRVFDEGGGDVCVAGPRTRAKFKTATGVARAVMFCIKPGWSASLLGVAASELTDRIVGLEDVWGRSARQLTVDLVAARTLPKILERLSRALAAHASDTFEPASARLARRAARLLEADEVRVDSVAERLGVTSRHLRRAFTEHVGVGPKDFARAARLQRAVRLSAESGASPDWSRVAADAGYYDQAHLIGDFRELVGLTPGAFARRRASPGTPPSSDASPCARNPRS